MNGFPITTTVAGMYGVVWIAAIVTERGTIHPYSRFTWEGEYLSVGMMLIGFSLATACAHWRTARVPTSGNDGWISIGLGTCSCVAYFRYFEPLLAVIGWLSWAEVGWRNRQRSDHDRAAREVRAVRVIAFGLCFIWTCFLLTAEYGRS